MTSTNRTPQGASTMHVNPAAIVQDELLTPGEVAKILKVNPKTVTRWAVAGKVRSILTPGGHRRLFRADVEGMLNGPTDPTEGVL